MSSCHIPVMVEEVLEFLRPSPGEILVDGTLGGGGHAYRIAEAVGANGRLIALDRDPQAILRAQAMSPDLPITAIRANFRHIESILEELEVAAVDGILLDLGLSSDQLADEELGFSFQRDAPLDMRFDPEQGVPAWQLLRQCDERQLADWIYEFGEERHSRKIARRIIEARQREPIKSTYQLADLVRGCMRSRGHWKRDPATRTFQALRILVNDELGALDAVLASIPRVLRPGGRAVVISFHSLEDRRVKNAFRQRDEFEMITRKPVRPSAEEVRRNPRARSARLRAATRRSAETGHSSFH
ncbi:MAG TPA: 16S rRNA (cytosine(1402)-N(4))-methyltransferase RsmH [Pirellulaceae bacterium]